MQQARERLARQVSERRQLSSGRRHIPEIHLTVTVSENEILTKYDLSRAEHSANFKAYLYDSLLINF